MNRSAKYLLNWSVAAAIGMTGFMALVAVGNYWFIPAIEDDLTTRSEAELVAAGIELNEAGATVAFDGRSGTVSGTKAEAGVSAVWGNVDGAKWNRPEVVDPAPPSTELAATPVMAPKLVMTRDDTRFVVFEGVIGTVAEEAALFRAAQDAGLEIVDALELDRGIERSTAGVELMVTQLLAGSDDSEILLEGGLITVTATAKDPVEFELIEAAIDSVETAGWDIERNLDVVVLPESVQIDKLQAEIDQIFELAREIEGESPNFETYDNELNSAATMILDRVIVAMRRYPLPSADVVGHTDGVGDEAENQALSEVRAEAVAAHLIEGGIGAERITTSGRGEAEPIADNTTQAGQLANRRVNFVVGRSGN